MVMHMHGREPSTHNAPTYGDTNNKLTRTLPIFIFFGRKTIALTLRRCVRLANHSQQPVQLRSRPFTQKTNHTICFRLSVFLLFGALSKLGLVQESPGQIPQEQAGGERAS